MTAESHLPYPPLSRSECLSDFLGACQLFQKHFLIAQNGGSN